MTNTLQTLTVLLLAFFTLLGTQAQEFNGKAYYKSHQKMNVMLDSNDVTPERQAAINEMFAKQFNKDYILEFDKTQSSYKEQEKLDEPTQATQGMVFVAISNASSLLYKNIKEKRYSSQRDLFGKEFLVKDELEKIDWKMSKETKQIGQYTCYKATSTRMTSGSVSIDGDGTRTEEAPEEITITAWYAPELPISNGPELYWGLPGLIMEVNDGMQTIICVKLVLNSDDDLTIQEPKKGKELNEEEFEVLMQEKMQEMEKIEMGGKQKEGEHTMKITIGG